MLYNNLQMIYTQIFTFLHGINFFLVGTSLLYFLGTLGAGIVTGFAIVRLLEAVGVTDWIVSKFTKTEEHSVLVADAIEEVTEVEQSDRRVAEVSEKLMKKYAKISGTRPEALQLQAVALQIYALLEAEYGEAIANGQPAPSLEEAIVTLAQNR